MAERPGKPGIVSQNKITILINIGINAMTMSIDQALVIQFSAMVHLLAQQMGSRLKGRVEEMPVRGNKFTYERLDKVEAIEVVTRHAATVAQDIAHSRRGGTMRDFRTTLLLDQFDELQVLIDPAQDYARAVARAMMRQYDRLCLESALDTVNTGRNLDVPVTASADGVVTVAANATGLTFDKLVQIHENFINAEVGVDLEEDLFLAITGAQHADLLSEAQLTSRDYTNAGNGSMMGETVIDRGRIAKAAGINLIVFGTGPNITNPLITATGTTRHCIAFAKTGLCVGMNKDISVRVDNRPDLNNAQQVQASLFFDAIRTEGVKVQQVDCVEA